MVSTNYSFMFFNALIAPSETGRKMIPTALWSVFFRWMLPCTMGVLSPVRCLRKNKLFLCFCCQSLGDHCHLPQISKFLELIIRRICVLSNRLMLFWYKHCSVSALSKPCEIQRQEIPLEPGNCTWILCAAYIVIAALNCQCYFSSHMPQSG